MARRRDPSTGRMLFTDFDASRTGRRAAELSDGSEGPEEYFPAYIPRIEELASSLELDFEDDWGSETAPGGAEIPPGDFQEEEDYIPDTPAGPAAAGGSASGRSSRRLIPGMPAAHRQPARDSHAAVRAITWDAFADAFQNSESRPPLSASSEQPAGEEIPENLLPAAADAGSPAPIVPGTDTDEFDILSLLDEYGNTVRNITPSGSGRGAGPAAPPDIPYGGLERIGNWYQPPEDGFGPEQRRGGWFEPPADEKTDAEAGTRRRLSADSTQLDMFSDVDLEALWQARLEKIRCAQGQPPPAADPADTRALDLFSDIDLDAVWEEKQRRRERPAAGRPARSSAGDTVMLSSDVVRSAIDAAFAPPAGGGTPVLPADAPAESPPPPASAPAPDDTVLLDEEIVFPPPFAPAESFAADPASSAAPITPSSSAGSPGTARYEEVQRRKKATSTDDFLDNLDFADVDAEVGFDVSAPVVSDSDIEPLNGSDEPEPAPAEAPPPADTDYLVTAREAPAAPADEEEEGEPLILADPIGLDALLERENSRDHPSVRVRSAPPAASAETAAGDTAAFAPAEGDVIDPMAAFDNLEEMDFSGDGLDDDMLALLEEDEEPELESADLDGNDGPPPASGARAVLQGMLTLVCRAGARAVPEVWRERIVRTVGWKEYWWFYCDLAAAMVASASLAVIVSYYLWYRK